MTIDLHGRLIRGDWELCVDDLTIGRGVTAVVGANGAGKTSLGRVIAGLDALAEGRLTIGGQKVDACDDGVFVPAHDRPVAMVFQDHRLFDHLRVIDNVAYPLRRRGVDRRVARNRAGDLLAHVGLAVSDGRNRPSALSGGQRQRVAIARALAREPDVLVVDEPLASVDSTGRAVIREVLRTAPIPTTLLVTHDVVDVQRMADRALVLDDGRIASHGAIADVAADPGSTWAATFLGSNVIEGRAHDLIVATDSGFALTLASAAEGRVHATFPAHAVTLHAQQPTGSARNTWPAVIERIDTDGERARVTLRGPIAVRADITRGSAEALALRPGVSIWASVKATEIAVVA